MLWLEEPLRERPAAIEHLVGTHLVDTGPVGIALGVDIQEVAAHSQQERQELELAH